MMTVLVNNIFLSPSSLYPSSKLILDTEFGLNGLDSQTLGKRLMTIPEAYGTP